MVEVTYKYRIYPTRQQQDQIARIIGTVRFVWNFFLAMKKQEYLLSFANISYNKCSAELTKLKHTKGYEWLLESDSTALQTALKYLDEAYKSFFRGNNGFPKFKSKKNRFQSYTTKNNNSSIRFENENRYLRLPKVGLVRIHCSRPISGKIQRATISITPTGKFFVSIICLQEKPELKTKVQGKACGIDLGEKNLVILSDGTTVPASRPLEKLLRRLALEQKRLSRKTKGSRSYEKQRLKVAKLHERIANIRNDSLQKASSSLIREYSFIGTENLAVKDMLQSSNLKVSARRIADSSWGEFLRMLEYKASWYDRSLIKVGQYFPSSQLCSVCNNKNTEVKDTRIRKWICPECGTIHDRDVNAAINIKNEALRLYGESLTAFVPSFS